jgi:aminopeptidase N
VGPYPYEKLANVMAFGIGGGTEHSSAIFYGERNLNAAGPFPLLAHEIAHQWFGCSVTEKDWDDVWLSEGFATYFTLMATEKVQGHEAFITGVKRSRDNVFATQRRMPEQPVIHPNLADMRGVLNQLVYQKGGWFLHMLRGRVGDEAFQKGIRAYYTKYRDKNASTDDFRAEMEAASGEKLEWFFTQWLKRPGTPVVDGVWSYDAAAKKIVVDLAQSQKADAFRLPLELAIGDGTADAPARLVKIEMTEKQQRFEIAAEKEPAVMVLDPETWMLMQATFAKK